MPTRTNVINDALAKLDQPASAGPNDSSTWVRRVTTRYDGVVRRLLSDHPWNFAEERVQLQKLTEQPIGWEYAYNKPGDCMRIIKVSPTGIKSESPFREYDDSGGKIFTNMDPAYLFYISDRYVNLEGSWPELFAYAVSLSLADLCSGPITNSRSKGETLERQAEKALSKAKSWDALQKPSELLPLGTWVRSMGRSINHKDDC